MYESQFNRYVVKHVYFFSDQQVCTGVRLSGAEPRAEGSIGVLG